MRSYLAGRRHGVDALIALLLAFMVQSAAAQESVAPLSTTNATQAVTTDPKPAANQQTNEAKSKRLPPRSKSIQEILKMTQAGVSKEVIKAYIENSPRAYHPSSADMIALKENGVSDDITIALLKRSAPAQSQPGIAGVPGPQLAGQGPVPGPESYDYFQRYYLFPRTLGAAYDRLGMRPAPYFPGY
jgi:hypothetical protein